MIVFLKIVVAFFLLILAVALGGFLLVIGILELFSFVIDRWQR